MKPVKVREAAKMLEQRAELTKAVRYLSNDDGKAGIGVRFTSVTDSSRQATDVLNGCSEKKILEAARGLLREEIKYITIELKNRGVEV